MRGGAGQFKMQKFKNVESKIGAQAYQQQENGLAGLPALQLGGVEDDDMETCTAYQNQQEFLDDRIDDFPELEEEYAAI